MQTEKHLPGRFSARRVIRLAFAALLVARWIASIPHANAAGCGFNVDALPIADPNSLAASEFLNDGLLVSRYLRGVRGAPLIAATRGQLNPNLADAVAAHMATYQGAHDMDASGAPDTNDGLIITRYLAGFRASALTQGLTLTGTRTAFTDIETYINSGCDTGASGPRQLVFIHPDVKGSPLMATDSNGNPLWREDYSAFGVRRKTENR